MKQQLLSALSPLEKSNALLYAARHWHSADVIYLLSIDTDASDTIEKLCIEKNMAALRLLINASLDPIYLLLDQVEQGNTDAVRRMITIDNLDLVTIEHLIQHEALTEAKALLSMTPDRGCSMLTMAMEMQQHALAKTLITLGADGSAALLALLKNQQLALAHQLAGLDVNVDNALMQAVRLKNKALQDSLITLNARPHAALLEALAAKDNEAIRNAISQLGDKALTDAVLALLGTAATDNAIDFSQKTEGIALLLQMNATLDTAFKRLLNDNNTEALQLLIKMGTPTEQLMITFAIDGNRMDLQKLIVCGADYTQPINILHSNGQLSAVTTLCLALAGAKERLAGPRPEKKR